MMYQVLSVYESLQFLSFPLCFKFSAFTTASLKGCILKASFNLLPGFCFNPIQTGGGGGGGGVAALTLERL